MNKNTVNLAINWHTQSHRVVKQTGHLCLAIGDTVHVVFQSAFSIITKYGYFSQFLMDFRETKLAIEFYDLDNLYLHLYIMEKDPETIETSHFDGIFPNRQ